MGPTRSCVASLLLALTWIAPLAGAVAGAPTPDVSGQAAGLREQWQPQVEHDARLQQPVEIEILGRATATGLPLLAEKTGVSLSVAPEDLLTVGDRKFTVVAKGCSLKSIMVQLPEALRECHWDVDLRGEKPAYLLHRNSGVEATMAELAEAERANFALPGREGRAARLESARRALAMSPAELAELEKTDLLLARAARDPESRKWMELALSLPAERTRQFVEKGGFGMDLSAASSPVQEAVRAYLRVETEKAKRQGDASAIDFFRVMNDKIGKATLSCEDWGQGGPGTCINLRISASTDEGRGYSTNVLLIPPRLPRFAIQQLSDILVRTGTPDLKTADALIATLVEKHGEEAQQEAARKEREREAEWREPRSPALHREITLPYAGDAPADAVEVQRFIAHETGVSLISDYYTTWMEMPIPEAARVAMPAWRLLYVLGDKWYWEYQWDEVGDCLVFHNPHWYRQVQEEVPESIVLACRDILQKQGGFTLEDVAGLAAAFAARRPLSRDEESMALMVTVPSDISSKGLGPFVLRSPLALLHATLSPEQRAKAYAPEGLPYAEMTKDQRGWVERIAKAGPYEHPVPDEEIPKASYRIAQSTTTTEQGLGDMLESGPKNTFELSVTFPSRQVQLSAWLTPPKSGAPPTGGVR